MARTAKPALAMLGLFLLTACGTGGDEGSEGSPTADQAEPGDVASEGSTAEDAEADEGTADTGSPQDATASMDDAVETITYPMQEHEGEITMGLLTPEVEGDSMLVSVVFQPDFADDGEAVQFSTLHGAVGGVLAPAVSDRQNMKAYHVPREVTHESVQGGGWLSGAHAGGAWASAIGDVEVRSGEQYLHWAYFPAPEDDIDTVDVAVIPGAQEFRDVHIDWGDAEPGSAGTGQASEEGSDDDA